MGRNKEKIRLLERQVNVQQPPRVRDEITIAAELVRIGGVHNSLLTEAAKKLAEDWDDLTRLRRIEKAAWAVVENARDYRDFDVRVEDRLVDELRDALDEK